MDDVMFHAEYDCSHDDCCKHCLVEVQFKGIDGSGGVYTMDGDLGYEGTVLHETGKADHDEGPCEQTSCLGLHTTGTVDSSPAIFCLPIQIVFEPRSPGK